MYTSHPVLTGQNKLTFGVSSTFATFAVMEDKKLFLLDAYALIYRAYYALLRSPRVNSRGVNTSAVFGFCNTLDELLRKENPGHIAVCFDPAHGKTFRHDEYPEYKAGRDKQPEDITVAIPYIKSILTAMHIPVIEIAGYEADDVIGTLSRRAMEAGFTTYMMTPDKDYGQLVNDRVFQYRPSIKGQGFELRGPKEVCERYGINSPEQVIDLLALEGDASDNVPGCPGVGEKTAVKLIAEFGSVENLLQSTDRLKGALQKKVIENSELIRLSKYLVTIVTDVAIDFDPEALRRREPDVDALLAIYKELEFRSFIAKYENSTKPAVAPAATEPKPTPQPDAQPGLFDFFEEAVAMPTTVDSVELTDLQEIADFVGGLLKASYAGMAIKSEGGEAMTARASAISFAYSPDEGDSFSAVSIVLPSNAAALVDVAAALKPVFAAQSLTLCGGDIKRDMLLLRRMGLEFCGTQWFDTSVAHYLCNPDLKHDTASLAMTYLGLNIDSSDMAAVATACVRLKPLLENECSEKGMSDLLCRVEQPFVGVLASMEWEGARIDPNELQRLSKGLTERLHKLEEQAYAIAGRHFNVSSPSQVGQILFGEMQIDPKARKTKGGAWSTAEDTLEKYAKSVPLVQLILDIRGLKKLLATYVDALPRLINPNTGHIHTTYNQTVTATGRISSTSPNLQNIPIRTDDGREIRRAFIANQGDVLMSADYSQIELRLMADMSGDSGMIDAFLAGEDIHRSTAAKIYHLPLAEVSDSQRRNAKTANFGIIYGISAFGLSERLGISRLEAKDLIEGYMKTYPGVAEYMQRSIEIAREKGYVSTIMGRRRYLPDINSRSNTVRSYAERNAINAPLQGSAADIIKVAMVELQAEMLHLGLRSRMIMQVHDELVFNVKPDELAVMQELVPRLMTAAYHGRVPMEVAVGVGNNWLEAH